MAGTGAALASGDNTLYIEGDKMEMNQSFWFVDGRTYAPVREFADLMGWKLSHNAGTGQITITNDIGDTFSFKTGSSEIHYNGNTYEISATVKAKDGSAYLPVRLVAEAMHANVGWRAEEKMSVIEKEQERIVESGDTLWSIAQAHQTTAEALKIRNGISDDSLQIGQRLKVVIPEFLVRNPQVTAAKSEAAADIDQAELMLLAKLVETEAGNEPYEGKLAVASVVMNRVSDGNYPNTVKGVIYEPYQFSPARNGTLAKTTASKDSIKAAKAALSGENNVPGAVYFFNPKLEPAKLKRVTVVAKIANHVFAK
ncbi:cell wall hydrolase [Cohnella kolymensis]|uniref:cell wall hydrolase n=1 Tax=Cohnella kolymensis TaxID=1590652 RepID=UPI0006974099|nr:cell wall hydrolase [Cohnella kolymensis]